MDNFKNKLKIFSSIMKCRLSEERCSLRNYKNVGFYEFHSNLGNIHQMSPMENIAVSKCEGLEKP